MSNVPSQSQLHEAGCSSATSPLIASSGTKRKRPSGKSTEALGNQAVQASNGKEAELSCGDEDPNDETTLPDRASLPFGKGLKALGKGFAERRPRQRALGKKFNGKEALCRGPFVGHSAKPFPSANGDTQQRKAAINGAAPLTAPLPSADS